MFTTRRDFLRAVGTAGIVSFSGIPPAFLSRAAVAAGQRASQSADGRALVLVQLSGGNDGLNTVVPYGDDAYYKARPGVGIGKGAVLKLDDYVGLHPGMQGFKELFDDGVLAVVQGVGYPNPDRSHFRSMDIWQSAIPEKEDTRNGWLGRMLDENADRHAGKLPALALETERLPLALVGSKVNVPLVKRLSDYQVSDGPGTKANQELFRKLLGQLSEANGPAGSDLDFLRQTARTAYVSAEKLKQIAASYASTVEYPANDLGRKLKIVAQMIAGELGTHVFFVSLDGFDTHSEQPGAHQSLLGELSSAVRAFYLDLKGHALEDRVLLATYSEFGRRVQENGSLGTDHGAASQMFVVARDCKGGLHGRHPSLTDLVDGDLKFHTDFRAVYATLLETWLGVPSETVLGGRFAPLDFV